MKALNTPSVVAQQLLGQGGVPALLEVHVHLAPGAHFQDPRQVVVHLVKNDVHVREVQINHDLRV